MDRLDKASVHGRLQPFHNGHLDYFLQAFERADFIFVGLTQIYRPTDAASKSGRDAASSNPLTFFERRTLVEHALVEAGITRSRFDIVPFPIEAEARLPEFLPTDLTCFTTVVSPWNDEKIDRLRSLGYPIQVLETSPVDNSRVTSGTHIRSLIRMGNPSWQRFVPPAVADLIRTKLIGRFDSID